MKQAKIIAIVSLYADRLRNENVRAKRISTDRSFASCTRDEMLEHACYLVENFGDIDRIAQYGKLNRHLSAIQMILSFAGWYTLEELMEHNRPG